MATQTLTALTKIYINLPLIWGYLPIFHWHTFNVAFGWRYPSPSSFAASQQFLQPSSNDPKLNCFKSSQELHNKLDENPTSLHLSGAHLAFPKSINSVKTRENRQPNNCLVSIFCFLPPFPSFFCLLTCFYSFCALSHKVPKWNKQKREYISIYDGEPESACWLSKWCLELRRKIINRCDDREQWKEHIGSLSVYYDCMMNDEMNERCQMKWR